MQRSKKYIEAQNSLTKGKVYEPSEAMAAVVATSKAKFDETVELHVKLGVDGRNADQQVRGVVVLPEGTGKFWCRPLAYKPKRYYGSNC